MLTYELKKAPGLPLYESLYRCIREDILSGKLPAGEKLPSKRALADHLELSKVTVEGAYAQLLSEGYIRSQEKIGYFVEETDHLRPVPVPPAVPEPEVPDFPVDLTSNAAATGFPFTVWMRIQRQVMLDYGDRLLAPLPAQGYPELRQAIAGHLSAFRNMQVDPGNILIGAGTDFLYNLLIQLLGRDKVYAVEEPGYGKIRRIYAAGGVECVSAPLDDFGVRPDSLGQAQVLHISPSHHFPTGLVTPVSRRMELLNWVKEGEKWIIEDDYDSEFRFDSHPKPALQSLDASRVIYMNSFSKSLAPSIRISYMVLPAQLMAQFQQKLGFYSCTVPSFEQYTLARFLSRGYFEKHINRMRKFYRSRRNRVVTALQSCALAEKFTILEMDAGLHFLLKVDTQIPDALLTERLEQRGIRIQALSHYYHSPGHENSHCFVVNYAGIREENIPAALAVLTDIM